MNNLSYFLDTCPNYIKNNLNSIKGILLLLVIYNKLK